MRTFIILLALLIAASPLSAQTPRTFSYQGTVAMPNGTPVPDGNHTFTIRLYDVLNAGTPLYTEQHSASTTDGMFDLIIGSVEPLPTSLSFSQQLWLGLSVDGGAELKPRTQMTSVPSALVAQTVDTRPASIGQVYTFNGLTTVWADPFLPTPYEMTSSKPNTLTVRTSSTAAGQNATTGTSALHAEIPISNPGAWSSAVRGVNNSTTANGIGVIGTQAGSGYGVYGAAVKGIGVFGAVTDAGGTGAGVYASSKSPAAAALHANYTGAGAGTALEITNGAIKVSGANPAAFVVEVQEDSYYNSYEIDHPLCNNDPNAMLFVIYRQDNWPDGGTRQIYHPLMVRYKSATKRWYIIKEDNDMPNQVGTPFYKGMRFNVLIIKQ